MCSPLSVNRIRLHQNCAILFAAHAKYLLEYPTTKLCISEAL